MDVWKTDAQENGYMAYQVQRRIGRESWLR